MPFAVTLCLDRAAASFVREMWHQLATRGVDADRDQLGYTPHVTLAIFPDEADADRIAGVVARLAEHWTAVPITLCGLGVFPGPKSVLWIAPGVTGELLSRHATLLAAVSGLAVDAHYRPDRWMPHITLTGALSDPGPALAVLTSCWRPISGVLAKLELVRFRPVEILQSYHLAP